MKGSHWSGAHEGSQGVRARAIACASALLGLASVCAAQPIVPTDGQVFTADTLFVPGHGQICGQEGIAMFRSLFDDIEEQAQKLYKAGVPVAEAVDRYVIPEKFKNISPFAWDFSIGPTIAKSCRMKPPLSRGLRPACGRKARFVPIAAALSASARWAAKRPASGFGSATSAVSSLP